MKTRTLWITGIIVAAAFSRLIPHPPNVTPIAAMALFGGAFYGRRAAAFLVPLAAMLLSDLLLAKFWYGFSFLGGQPVIYLCIIATVLMGRRIRDRRSAWSVAGVCLLSSILFFVATNFAVWADGQLYPRNLAGLETCFTAAIPFFRNSLTGDLAFSAILFGGFALLERLAPALPQKQTLAVV